MNEAKAAAKYEKRLRSELSKLKGERFELKVSRVGLWLIPIIGWLFLPGNGRKIARIDDSVRDIESKLRVSTLGGG